MSVSVLLSHSFCPISCFLSRDLPVFVRSTGGSSSESLFDSEESALSSENEELLDEELHDRSGPTVSLLSFFLGVRLVQLVPAHPRAVG